MKRANRVITISEFSRGEIIRHLHVSREKVSVVYLAGRDHYGDAPLPPARPEIVRNVSRPYILAFSSLSAHKNVSRLIAAFARISSAVPHSLVLVGHLPEKAGVRGAIEAAGDDRIHFTGFLPDADVDALMRDASLFAFPSLYEGFGLPIIDAQHAGVPVACSSAGALPEVAGDAAVQFDPLSVEDMADTLKRCLLDMDLRMDIVAKGHRNAQRFSWHRTARETVAIYNSVGS